MKIKKGLATMWLVVIVGAILFVALGGLKMFGEPLAIGGEEAEVVGDGISDCAVEDTTVTLRSYDIENKGTATGDDHRVWLNGVYVGIYADGGTLTASPGDEVEVLFGNYSEMGGHDLTSSFYPTFETSTLGCVGTKTLAGFQKDLNSSAVTVNVFNADNGFINTVWGASADTQDLSADGEETVEMKLQATSEDFFGDGDVIVVFDANQNAFSDVILEGATETSAPSHHSSVANSRTYAYEISELAGSKRESFDITLKAGSTEPDGTNGNVTITLYDSCYYVNAETNEIVKGYSDEDNNDLCGKQAIGAVYVS